MDGTKLRENLAHGAKPNNRPPEGRRETTPDGAPSSMPFADVLGRPVAPVGGSSDMVIGKSTTRPQKVRVWRLVWARTVGPAMPLDALVACSRISTMSNSKAASAELASRHLYRAGGHRTPARSPAGRRASVPRRLRAEVCAGAGRGLLAYWARPQLGSRPDAEQLAEPHALVAR